jgi:hypothetical protein
VPALARCAAPLFDSWSFIAEHEDVTVPQGQRTVKVLPLSVRFSRKTS